jgi:hypothetical protein
MVAAESLFAELTAATCFISFLAMDLFFYGYCSFFYVANILALKVMFGTHSCKSAKDVPAFCLLN